MPTGTRLVAVARRALRRPASSKLAIRTAERLRRHDLAERLGRIRSEGDLVPITLPGSGRGRGSGRFVMHGLDGRDLIARYIRADGWDGFEAPLPSVVADLVRRSPATFFDVGANTGFYSLIAVTADRRTRVIAFEPVPEIVALLEANLAANPRGHRVTVRPCAITDRTGSVELHLPPPQADGTVETSASVESDFKEVVERTVTVDGRTLDDAWITEDRPDVSLVKIDVEGAEHRVLAGADLVVASCRPVLSIEVLPSAHLDEIDAFRDRHDYVDVTLTPTDAVVNHPTITYHSDAPNHLLVPRERTASVEVSLRSVPGLRVTVLD